MVKAGGKNAHSAAAIPGARGSAVLACLGPMLAWATAQCPPHPGGRSWTATALVWLLLLAFGLAGSMLPIATYRATAGTRWFKRVPILSLGVLAMLAVWLLGLWVFFNLFVMTCANF